MTEMQEKETRKQSKVSSLEDTWNVLKRFSVFLWNAAQFVEMLPMREEGKIMELRDTPKLILVQQRK